MAGKSDGSFIIDSKFNLSGFTNGVVNMKDSFGKIASAAGKMGAAIKSAFTVKSKGADGLEEKSEEIKISVDDTAKSVEDGMKRINNAMSSGADAESFDTIQDKIDTLSEHLKSLEAQGMSFGYEEYDKTYQALVLAEDELKQYKTALAEAARAQRDSTKEVGLFQSVLWELGKAAHAPISILKLLGKTILNIPHLTLNLVVNGLKKIGNSGKSATKIIGKYLFNSLKKLGTVMIGLNKHTKRTGNGFKNILKYGLGIRSLYALVNKIRNAIKEGFQNLAQYSEETNASLSMLKSSMTQLKNSLATAFSPIVEVIAPALTQFINLLSQAITYVGMFFAALTGKNSFAKAVAVQEDYAASLGETADNAKEAKKYLSGLDEIQTYTSDKDSSGGGGAGGVSPADMFENVNIPDFISDWVKKFKEAWANADFTEIGKMVGAKLRDALDGIPWESIKAKCNQIAQSLATFINGFIDTPGLWEVVEMTIGEAINTGVGAWNTFFDVTNFIAIGGAIATALNNAVQTIDAQELGKALSQKIRAFIETAYGFVTTFDWSSFGTWIGQAINGFFDNIDFGLAAQTLSQGIIGALNGLTAAIQEVDWYSLGQKVKEFLVNIDWGGIIGAMFEAIGAALGGLAMFLWGLIEDAWNSVVDWWHDVAFEDGEFTIKGLLNGIVEAVKNIGTWIKEHIFNPFIEGFKSVFGIHSPSTVMEEQGSFLIEGLLNGIKSWISNIREVFGTIKETILGKWDEVKTKTSEVWGNIKTSVSDKWGSLKSTASEKFGAVKDAVSGAWEKTGSATSDTWGKVSSTVGSVWDTLKTSATNKFGEIKTKVSDSWNNIKILSSTVWNEIKSSMSTIWNGLKTLATTAFNGIKTSITTAWNSVSSLTSSIWNNIKSTVSSAWSNINSIVSSLVNTFSNAVNLAKSAASNIISAFSNIRIPLPHFSIGSTAHSIAGVKFSLPKVSVDWYAKGGLFDQPSVIGVGEAGQEAVLPLTNSKVMSLLASNIVAKMPTPYLASGAVLPPKATSSSVNVQSNKAQEMESIYEIMNAMLDKLNNSGHSSGGNTYEFTAQINRRTLFDEIITEAKLRQTVSGGINPFMLGR